MSIDQVTNEFGWALAAAAGDKDGNVLADDLARRASWFVESDRASLITVVRDWLECRDELLTVQGTLLAGSVRLVELKDEVEDVRADVVAGRFLEPSSVWLFDRVIARLTDSRC